MLVMKSSTFVHGDNQRFFLQFLYLHCNVTDSCCPDFHATKFEDVSVPSILLVSFFTCLWYIFSIVWIITMHSVFVNLLLFSANYIYDTLPNLTVLDLK